MKSPKGVAWAVQTLEQVNVIWLHWLLRVHHITTLIFKALTTSDKFWKRITMVCHIKADNYRFRSLDRAFANRFFSWFLHLRSLAWNSLAASVDMLLPNCWAHASAHFCDDKHLMRETGNTIQSLNHNFIIFIQQQ